MTQHFLGDGREVPAECPNCGTVHDMASAVDDNVWPKPGDASICIMCGHLSVFDEHLKLRHMTDDEVDKYAGDDRIVAAMTALHYVRKEK